MLGVAQAASCNSASRAKAFLPFGGGRQPSSTNRSDTISAALVDATSRPGACSFGSNAVPSLDRTFHQSPPTPAASIETLDFTNRRCAEVGRTVTVGRPEVGSGQARTLDWSPARLRLSGPLKSIQEQIEPELELGLVTVPRPHDMLGRDLGKVGLRPGRRELAHNGLGHLRSLLSGVERQARLLQRETVDVAVEGGVGMSGERQ